MKRAGIFAALVTLLLAPVAAVAQSAPSDFTSATRYDDAGRVTGTIAPDPDGPTGPLHYGATRTTYDDAGRAVRIEQGELSGWQSESVAPSAWSGFTPSAKVETSYDALDRKVLEGAWGWDVVNAVWVQSTSTQYSYDAAGQLECTAIRMKPSVFATPPSSACTLGPASTVSGPDRITKNVYDAAGQLLKVVKAYGITTANGFAQNLQQDYVTYTYSANGKPLSVKDADGNVASYSYDGFDRQVRWSFPDKAATGAVSATDYESYGYDANGNRTSWRKRDGRTFSYSYDALNRVTVKAVPDGGCPADPDVCTNVAASATRDVYYAYDLRGLQTAARFDSTTGGDAVVNGYDGFGRLTATTTAMGGVSRTIQHGYDPDGNRADITWPDLLKASYGHDGLDRLDWVYEGTGAILAQYGYTAAAQPYFLSRVSGLNTVYYYDARQRLSVLANDFNGTSSDLAIGLDYNPAGQIVGRSRDNSTPYAFTGYTNVSRAYAANGLNQYTSSGGTALGYEANGNLRSSGTSTYAYDAENRLVGMAVGGTSAATLTYDPLGRLYEVQGGTGTRRFLYDGDEMVAEYDGGAPGTMLARYIHGAGTDDPIVWYAGSAMSATTRRFLHIDQQGSIIAVSDATGNAIATNTYDEYGIPGTNTGTFQYTGQIWLPEVGLYYYKARMYSASLGRFMQTDPIGYDDGPNWYAYVGNDPVNNEDPSGECAFICGAVIGAAIDGGIEAGSQLWNQGEISDWGSVGRSALRGAAIGALTGGIGNVARAFQVSRAAFNAARVEGVLIHTGVLGRGALTGERGLLAGVNALRNAAIRKGNYGLGSATAKEASRLGRAWVGQGSRVASDGRTLLSKDGLRQFRPGAPKADGSVQANFERRVQNADKSWSIIGNGHLKVVN